MLSSSPWIFLINQFMNGGVANVSPVRTITVMITLTRKNRKFCSIYHISDDKFYICLPVFVKTDTSHTPLGPLSTMCFPVVNHYSVNAGFLQAGRRRSSSILGAGGAGCGLPLKVVALAAKLARIMLRLVAMATKTGAPVCHPPLVRPVA